MLYAMEPIDADWYTRGGFWLSVVGVAVSTVGLAATYYQVRKARKSADAARDAAEATLRDSLESFRRYLAAVMHRQLAEVETFVTEERWGLASIRCEDIALSFAQLAEPMVVDEFRYFSRTFRAKSVKANSRYGVDRWATLLLDAKKQLDTLIAPFAIGRAHHDND